MSIQVDYISPIELAAKRDRILNQVSDKHGIYVTALKEKSRAVLFVRARQEAMYRLRKELPLSLARIARLLGLKHHTTVIHGIKAHCHLHGLPMPDKLVMAEYEPLDGETDTGV